MNKKALLLLLFIVFKNISAQRHEIGLQFGMSNLVGDVGNTSFILQKPFGFSDARFSTFGLPFYGGIMYRMNFNPYQSLRFDVGYNHIQFSDAYAKEIYRQERGYYGANSLAEANVLFEYYFLPVNNEQKSMLSPYIFGGIGALLTNVPTMVVYNDFYRDTNGVAINPADVISVKNGQQGFITTATQSTKQDVVLSIPFGVGLKYKFNYNWALSGEFTFRPTFSDEIDYSNISDKNVRITYNKDIPDPNNPKKSLLQTDPYYTEALQREAAMVQSRRFGNTNSKDWVNTASLILSYSFGRPPCNCDQ